MASALSNLTLPSAEDVTSWISQHPVAVGSSLVAVFGLVAIRRWAAGGRCTSKARLDGKTVIITGGNSGIGYETAKDLARRGGRVILACRSRERGEEAVSKIKEATGNNDVIFKKLDLASFASVRAFAADVLKTEARIDILINNAAWVGPYTKTEDGNEMQWQVNHLSHFLLTNLLLDKIKASAPARIINVSSLAHKFSKPIDWEDLNYEKHEYVETSMKEGGAYERTKLANVLFTDYLAKKLKGTSVTVNSLHPGLVKTNIAQNLRWQTQLLVVIFYPLYFMLAKAVDQGAQTTIHVAVAKEVENVSGAYFADCKIDDKGDLCNNEETMAKLWQVSAEAVKLE